MLAVGLVVVAPRVWVLCGGEASLWVCVVGASGAGVGGARWVCGGGRQVLLVGAEGGVWSLVHCFFRGGVRSSGGDFVCCSSIQRVRLSMFFCMLLITARISVMLAVLWGGSLLVTSVGVGAACVWDVVSSA